MNFDRTAAALPFSATRYGRRDAGWRISIAVLDGVVDLSHPSFAHTDRRNRNKRRAVDSGHNRRTGEWVSW